MNSLGVKNNENELILDTPNRDEILHSGPPQNSKCNILGRGAYGVVFKAVYAGKQVAVKIMKNVKNDAISNEANILRWRHRNIVQLIKIESTVNYGIVIMERFPGQCLQGILNSIEIPLEHRIYVVLDIVNALTHCHKRKILHLDVKPQNVLVDFSPQSTKRRKVTVLHGRNYICKICDFGSSVVLQENDQENTRKRIPGTVRYMSPEAIREDILSSAADVYSLGVTMWQLKSRQLPYFWIECNESVAYQVVKTHLRPNHATFEQKFENLGSETSSLHTNCLCDHFSSEISHRTLDHIRSALYKTKTLSPFAPRNNQNNYSRNRNALEKLKSQTSKNLIGKFQNTFAGLRDNLVIDETTCDILEDQINCDFPLTSLFTPKASSTLPEAENLFEDLYKLCWSSEPKERPSTLQVKRKLESLFIPTKKESLNKFRL
ncbi:serine/threonine-protein kinase mos [Episyrphus balteatus]|uniref:serine/threonine-protein kinase mos n=1 Tax=Episyrphus balteatus TaxID=286459 RepID=UPI0024857E1A|nr:serine/threonine-protein kinase mos [Episyrphus balteatus]